VSKEEWPGGKSKLIATVPAGVTALSVGIEADADLDTAIFDADHCFVGYVALVGRCTHYHGSFRGNQSYTYKQMAFTFSGDDTQAPVSEHVTFTTATTVELKIEVYAFETIGAGAKVTWSYSAFPCSSQPSPCAACSSYGDCPDGFVPSCDGTADVKCVAADDVSITADPHVKNLRGRKFDVRKLGSHTMLVIPNDSAVDKSLLHIGGTVTAATKDCSVAFLHNVTISGRWLRDSAPVSQKCGAISQLQFSAADAPGIHNNWTGFTIGNSSFGSMEKLNDCSMHKMIKFQRPGEAQLLAMANLSHATSMTAQLALGPVRVKLSWVTHRIHDFSLVNALWMSVSGLSAVPETIGGVLSADDHHEVETMDADCWTADQSKMQ